MKVNDLYKIINTHCEPGDSVVLYLNGKKAQFGLNHKHKELKIIVASKDKVVYQDLNNLPKINENEVKKAYEWACEHCINRGEITDACTYCPFNKFKTTCEK